MSTARHVPRNLRLLAQAAAQHLADDPALLAVQVSRRAPLAIRSFAGRALRRAATPFRRAVGIAALGAYMAGETTTATRLVETAGAPTSRLKDEVALLLGRPDMLSASSPVVVRSRAAWLAGDLSGALQMMEKAGHCGGRSAARWRSELALLEPGHRVSSSSSPLLEVRRDPGEGFRVLHLVTNSLPHTQSGYSLRTHRILTALRELGIDSLALTRTGYPVMVGVPNARDEDVVDGIRYLRTLPVSLAGTQEEKLSQQIDAALTVVESYRPHVIHATTNYYNALVAQAVSSATGIPWILEVRGLMEQTWIASHATPSARAEAASSERARAVALREGELANEADAVVTLGRSMADVLIDRGVPPERITLVPNGIDEALLHDRISVDEARRRIPAQLPKDAFVVGALSALVDYEGFDILLDAAAALIHSPETPRSIAERLHVMIAGDGVAAPGLLEQARALRISDRVHLPGRVPRGEAAMWVQVLDVVVVPRLDREVTRSVTPQKPAEAMALSRPLIVSDLPALRETVLDADGVAAAALVPPGDAVALGAEIMRFAEDPSLREGFAAKGRAVAERRTWSSLMRRYKSLYAELTNENLGGASDER